MATASTTTKATSAPARKGLGAAIEDQFALRQLIREYLIPAETNNIWYTLGGVLAIALVLEVLTGFLLTLVYAPDAGRAYGITKDLLSDGLWAVVINFHFWTAYVIFGLVVLHYYLIKVKGISLPFWLKESGRRVAFGTHIFEWFKYSGVILGAVLLLSIFVQRDAGIAPQLIPSSPLFGSPHGPGGNGAKPTFPIGWTHGMNVFFGQFLHID